MTIASRDENNVPTLIAVLDSDGSTIVPVKVNVSGAMPVLEVEDSSTGSDNGPGPRALRDGNFVTTLIGVSSVDGVTPVAVYADSDGNLLIDSN